MVPQSTVLATCGIRSATTRTVFTCTSPRTLMIVSPKKIYRTMSGLRFRHRRQGTTERGNLRVRRSRYVFVCFFSLIDFYHPLFMLPRSSTTKRTMIIRNKQDLRERCWPGSTVHLRKARLRVYLQEMICQP